MSGNILQCGFFEDLSLKGSKNSLKSPPIIHLPSIAAKCNSNLLKNVGSSWLGP